MASRVMRIDPIWRAIGSERAKAFPAFHAFTGADNTGRLSRIGKATWFQVYMKADRDVISFLQMLSTEAEVTQTMLANLARFLCAAYSPKGININTISELRWYLFCKHMPFQLLRPSLRWSAAIAKQTVLLPDVLAKLITYPAPIFADVAVSVRMTRTPRTSMKLMMTMMMTISK